MLQNVNEISHIDNTNCNQCIKTNFCIFKNRKKFIKKCLPFNNFDITKKNILNFDKTSYIYYYNDTTLTYYIDKNFMLHNYKSKPPPYKNININTEEILYSKFEITNTDTLMYGYYLFCNYDIIFNIFANHYDTFIKEKKKYLEILLQEKNNLLADITINNNKIDKIKNELNIESDITFFANQIKELKNNMNIDKTEKKKQDKILKENLKPLLNIYNTHPELIELKSNITFITKELKYYNNEIDQIQEELEIIPKIINNIMQIDDNNDFIKLSYKFNIFNISLLCENYFNIIEILLNREDIIIDEIIDLFKDFSLVNIFYLINYYKTNLNVKNINPEFMANEVCDDDNINNPQIYNKIIHNEKQMKNITEINIDTIYRKLYLQLKYIKIILDEIAIYIPNYKKLFLMAIIAYRNNNELINDTWGYLNKNYIMNYIIDNEYRNQNNQYNKKLLKSYYINNKLILYTERLITYKNQQYGNCMENTIFQFLKVLFWDNSTYTYNKIKIKEIIKPQLYTSIIYFFTNIILEKQIKFINMWVKFITELPIDCINNIYNFTANYGKYNFIKSDFNVEINPTLNNLIIALKYLTIVDDKIDDPDIFITTLINKINNKYELVITGNYDERVILELYFITTMYILKLNKDSHASFTSNTVSNNVSELNILHEYNNAQSVPPLNNYLDKSLITFSNLNAYVIYKYLDNNNDILYNYIIKINAIEKNKLIEIFFDSVKDKWDDQLLYNIILNNINIINDDIIYNILKYNIDNIKRDIKFKKYDSIKELLFNIDIIKLLCQSKNQLLVITLIINLVSNKQLNNQFVQIIISNNFYKLFDRDSWLQIIDLYSQNIDYSIIVFKFLEILQSDTIIVKYWDIRMCLSLLNIYYHTELNEHYKEIIQIILNNINIKYTDIDNHTWFYTFYNLDRINNNNLINKYYYSIVKLITHYPIIYKQWDSITWNYFLLLFNKSNNNEIDISVLDYIISTLLDQNIVWANHKQFWKKLILFGYLPKITDIIIQKDIIPTLLEINIDWTNQEQFWKKLILLGYLPKIADIIIQKNIHLQWSQEIWRSLVLFEDIIYFKSAITESIFNSWTQEMKNDYLSRIE